MPAKAVESHSRLPTELTDDELEAAMVDLQTRIRGVEVQLGQHRRYDANGVEFSLQQFDEWRRSAKFAREAMLERYRALKAERRSRSTTVPTITGTLESLDEKFDEMLLLLRRIVELLESE